MRLGRFGEKQLRRAAADLGLQALPLAPSSSGYPTCVLCWPETVGTPVSWNTDFAHTVIHGFGVAALDVGLPTPLSFISAHLSPFGALRALMEADMIIHGPTGMAPTRSSPETSTTRQRTGRIRYSTA